jgi:hypothetical protein
VYFAPAQVLTSEKDYTVNGIEELPGIDPSKAHVARMYDYYLLRHEALRYRAGVRDLRRRAVAAA